MDEKLDWARDRDVRFEVLGTGDLPVVVHVPHAGLWIPGRERDDITLDDDDLRVELRRMTDAHTDLLADGAVELGASAFVNRLSRLVVDPERFLDPQQEVMEDVGMGAVYTRTADGRVLREPDQEERQRLVGTWFVPYATALAEHVSTQLDRHGRVVLVDLHSYPSERLAYEVGGAERPHVCIGTDSTHTPSWLADAVAEQARRRDWTVAHDSPFSGTYVPMALLGDARVLSVMVELRRDLYVDEATWRPTASLGAVCRLVADIADVAGRGAPDG